MIHIKLFNKSSVSESTIAPFLSKLKDRLDSVDFSKFGIENYTMHIVINADNESVKIASALSKEGRYIFYQGIPQEYAYNSSFEAKLATIRLRIQNIEVSLNLQSKILFLLLILEDHLILRVRTIIAPQTPIKHLQREILQLKGKAH